MQNINMPFGKIVAASMMAGLVGCSVTGGSATAKLTAEENLNCAGLIFAANKLMYDKKVADDTALSGFNHVGPLTSYTTAYATAKKMTGAMASSEALGAVKITAFGFLGIGSNSKQISADGIVRQAKACLANLDG